MPPPFSMSISARAACCAPHLWPRPGRPVLVRVHARPAHEPVRAAADALVVGHGSWCAPGRRWSPSRRGSAPGRRSPASTPSSRSSRCSRRRRRPGTACCTAPCPARRHGRLSVPHQNPGGASPAGSRSTALAAFPAGAVTLAAALPPPASTSARHAARTSQTRLIDASRGFVLPHL